MFRSQFRGMMLLLAAAVLTAGVVWADVRSDIVSGQAAKGSTVLIPLKINTTQSIAGINGELDFDSTLFSNPSIMTGAGAVGFIALGNQIANSGTTARYRFVIYSDPTKAFNPALPIASFSLKVASAISKSQVSTLTYQTPASGDNNASSIGTFLGDIRISLNGNSANDWALYE